MSKPRPKRKPDLSAGLKLTDSISKVIDVAERNGGVLYFEMPGPDGGWGIQCKQMKRIRGCIDVSTPPLV